MLISLCCGLFPLSCVNFVVLWFVSVVACFRCVVNFVALWLVSVVACFLCVVLVLLCCGLFLLWLVSVMLC